MAAQVDFENLLKEAMGLHTASIGSATTHRAVRQRMATLGLEQTDDYWRQLRNSANELQQLIEAVVVPETWFFRDREAFSALTRVATEEWRPAHPGGVLRLLSAPCSTGEEPYSMAMSLLDGGFSAQEIRVDAIDISARSLARAARGVYGSNSFRGEPVAFRERYFRASGDDYVLAESLRGMVTFRQRNLLSPDFSLNQELYDVVFCRNLLIYFDRPTQERAMKTLARLLTPGGFLFVGPAETFLASNSGFTSMNQSMSFAFRKAGSPAVHSGLSLPAPRKPIKKQPSPPPQQMASTSFASDPAPAPSGPPLSGLEAARCLADCGRLEEAAAWCEANLLKHGPSSETYYLLGLVRDAAGDRKGAAACYRKVVYLEPQHLEGLMHLALVCETEGDLAAASRLRERARRVERRANEKVS